MLCIEVPRWGVQLQFGVADQALHSIELHNLDRVQMRVLVGSATLLYAATARVAALALTRSSARAATRRRRAQ